MSRARRLGPFAMVGAMALLLGLVPTVALGAVDPRVAASAAPQLPQPSAARQAAQWLAGQLTPQGYIPTAPGSGVADFSTTAQSVLALSAANTDLAGARSALAYLEANVDQYVVDGGVDGPGQLSLLILDAEALGADPTSFGGTNLVSRLLATEQASGPDAGLFGSDDQAANFSAGGYQQGLALAALASAGVRGTSQVTSAISWLVAEQCPDGGWTSPDNTNNACSGDPASFAGPDTNSTAFAIEGLAAQDAVTPAISAAALAFLTAGQDADGGWSYYPSTVTTPGSTDPDSTALVIQALLALGTSPTGASFTKGAATPVSTLLSFQLTSGADAGAFYYPPAPAPGNAIATYEAVPALAGLILPFGSSGGSYWLAGADGGVFAFGRAGNFGSLPALGIAVHDITSVVSTADGKGYWLGARDGGIFGFGDAPFYGSLPALGVHVSDVVGQSPTSDGAGYWLVGADGGAFAFGDAGYVGSLPALGVHVSDVVGIVPTSDGQGYWLVGADGGVFAFGDAGYIGSLPALGVAVTNVVGIAPTADALGYTLASRTGGVYAFGDARFAGSAAGLGVSDIVGIAASPARPS
ncbi:MAG TPA: prenyltransferase/squalene oxidase repeat-containing protein [Acidimicrobiales bacterium]